MTDAADPLAGELAAIRNPVFRHGGCQLRALVSRLNGAPPPRKAGPPVRLSRKNRAVLLVLLSGASNLGGYTICRAAGLGSGTVHPTLARLESIGWVDSTWGPYLGNSGLRRRLYHLTRKGRIGAEDLLGLHAPGDPPAMMPAPVADDLPAVATALHAHEITPADAACIRMMAGAHFGPDSRVTLPSGRTITGAEMARWLEAPQ